MDSNFPQISDLFSEEDSKLLTEGKWGIEREAQRVTPAGDLALTPHPAVFGNKLENPLVTTDFAESQMELVTPAFDSVEKAHEYLGQLQVEVEKELGDELLWPLSMPPRLPEEGAIPIARFGDSPLGAEKEIYRIGLAHRYGMKMQMISGIHYNFSFGSGLIDRLYQKFGEGMDKRHFADRMYFSMARNFLRYRWLLIYLFGASPGIDPSYYSVIQNELKLISRCCPDCCNPTDSFEENAASLRVSRFGYSDSVQGKYSVTYNSLDDYIKGIHRLLSTKSKKFHRMGLFQNGHQIQLNWNILQKESEFYSSIRLKQNTVEGETQLDALESRGVKYAEVRIIDLDPFVKTGISLDQMRFLQVFMLFCLFEDGRAVTSDELDKINRNHHLAALAGRRSSLKLYRYNAGKIFLKDWSCEIFSKLKRVAAWMDGEGGENGYQDCVWKEFRKVNDPALLPSARIQSEMKQTGESFLQFGIRKAVEHRKPAQELILS